MRYLQLIEVIDGKNFSVKSMYRMKMNRRSILKLSFHYDRKSDRTPVRRFPRDRNNEISFLARIQIYEECCQILDMTIDWQIRGLLPYDTIILSDRSFSFNGFRAFATAIDINLEHLTLNAVGLTSRSVHVLCQGLRKCSSLTLLVRSIVLK